VDSILAVSRAIGQGFRNENVPTTQVALGLSLPIVLPQPWTVFCGFHYLHGFPVRRSSGVADPVSAWRLDLANAKTSPELMYVPQAAGKAGGTTHAHEAQATQLRHLEQAFERTLGLYAAGFPRQVHGELRTKDEMFMLLHAGAALMTAMASARYGWPAGGARVVRDFDAAVLSGTVDFSKLWPRSSFRQSSSS
jgi:hypothetical protein